MSGLSFGTDTLWLLLGTHSLAAVLIPHLLPLQFLRFEDNSEVLSQTTLDAGIPWILEQMKTVRAQTSLDHNTCTSMKGEKSQCTGFSWLSWAQRTTGSKLPWFEGCRKLCKTHSAQTALLNTVYFLTCISVPQPLFKFPGK